jgi:hypothetical protein
VFEACSAGVVHVIVLLSSFEMMNKRCCILLRTNGSRRCWRPSTRRSNRDAVAPLVCLPCSEGALCTHVVLWKRPLRRRSLLCLRKHGVPSYLASWYPPQVLLVSARIIWLASALRPSKLMVFTPSRKAYPKHLSDCDATLSTAFPTSGVPSLLVHRCVLCNVPLCCVTLVLIDRLPLKSCG